ncbi:MAG: hypothetical protein M1837_001538 [Sclerophora amabilis]|nr:MAG: hypothetical protein M1837_001538 [Sclerophora amabilis]
MTSLEHDVGDPTEPVSVLDNAIDRPPFTRLGPSREASTSPTLGPTRHLSNAVPNVSSTPDVALASLQYLPVPVVVLCSRKTVLLANEAMGRLLGLDRNTTVASDNGNWTDGAASSSVTDILAGQTLSQLGVDMLQAGKPVQVDWGTFLDNLTKDIDGTTPAPENATRSPGSKPSNQQNGQLPPNKGSSRSNPPWPRDVEVDVLVSPHRAEPDEHSASTAGSTSGPDPVSAKMVVTAWKATGHAYYILTFTHSPPTRALRPSHAQSPRLPRTPASLSPEKLSSQSSSNSGLISLDRKATPSSDGASDVPSRHPAPPNEAVNLALATSVLPGPTRVESVVVEKLEMPVYVMSKDGSLTMSNEAGRQLLQRDTDSTSEGDNMISRFRVWSEDFERELEPKEHPIIELCQQEKPISRKRVGMKHNETGKHIIFEISGRCIYDNKTGKFLAGLMWCTDVTGYIELIAGQTEEIDERFQTICDTMPQMVWTTTPDGYHDYFSQQWVDYTGLTIEDSIGTGWQLPFHPSDMPITGKRWAHSLATGETYTTEYRCRRWDGEWRWMLGRALPLRDSKTGKIVKWFGTCTDIHDLVEARLEAKRNRGHLLDVISHSQVTVWAVDRHRKLTLLEGRMMWEIGKDPDECSQPNAFIGKNIYEAFGEHADSGILDPLEEILSGKTAVQVSEFLMSDRWYKTRFVPIMGEKMGGGRVDSSLVDGVIGFSMDVTELRTREADMHCQERENSRLLANEAAAKQASRMKSQFLANVSVACHQF